MTTLGQLEKVPLRDVWSYEDRSFTPWLAETGNIELLGNAIGLELEVEGQEKAVGPYRADILCKSTIDDHLVLVENQLEKTNHTHLGQILTYAAGLHAVTIVWIAERFVEEHRAALDWLNEVTDSSVNFFGLEIELWRIGSSPVAPKFNIVSKPNDWSKTIRGGAAGGKKDLTPTKQLQLEYWEAFSDYLDERGLLPKRVKARGQHWLHFAVGRSKFNMNATVDSNSNVIRVRLNMSGPDAKAHFHMLEERRDEIEKLLGYPVIWHENPEKIQSALIVERQADFSHQNAWNDQFEWLASRLVNFHDKVGPIIKTLDASNYQEADQEDEDL